MTAKENVPCGSDGQIDSAYQRTQNGSNDLIYIESAMWLLSSGICKMPGAFITPMGTPMWPE